MIQPRTSPPKIGTSLQTFAHLIKNRIVHAAFFSAKRTRGYRGPVPQLRLPAEEALQVLPPVRPPGHGAGESDNGHLLLNLILNLIQIQNLKFQLGAVLSPRLFSVITESGQILQGSFSAVSKPIITTQYSLESGKLSPRSTQFTPLHSSPNSMFYLKEFKNCSYL